MAILKKSMPIVVPVLVAGALLGISLVLDPTVVSDSNPTPSATRGRFFNFMITDFTVFVILVVALHKAGRLVTKVIGSDEGRVVGISATPSLKQKIGIPSATMFVVTLVFVTVFVEPIKVGDPVPLLLTVKHSLFNVITFYIVMVVVFLFAVRETIWVVRRWRWKEERQ